MARTATYPVAVPPEGLAQAIAAYEAATGRRTMSTYPHLTHREQEVLAFLTVGKTNREIATELNLSEGTVKTHLSSIYAKLDVSNRTEAAVVGLRIFPLLRALAS
jgi:Response regulator containing a CheY-like receiver domain and an HTH DNA-binding domain